MPDEIVIEDDSLQANDDQQHVDEPVQDTPPEEPAARAAYFETKFKEEELARRGAEQDKKRLEGIVEDERTSKGFWKQQAEAKAAEPSKPTKAEAQKADALDDVIEGFDLGQLAVETGTEGGKKLLGIVIGEVEKRLERKYANHVKPDDVEAAIDRRLNTIVAQGRLAERFPDLADTESEFTKKVNARTVQLAKDPGCEGMSQIALMRLAAAEVESENGGKAKRENGNGDREARVNRQSVQGRGPRQTAKPSTELNEQQKKFARIAGITDAEYAKEANEGIRTYPTLGSQ